MEDNLVYPEHNSEFAKSIAGFYIGKKFRDITFVCKQNMRVHAHKAVLAAFSKFLLEVISSNGQDIVYISLPDIDQDKLKLLLVVLYRGSVRLKHEELIILKDICSYLCIDISNLNIQEVAVTENYTDISQNEFWNAPVQKSDRRGRPSKRKRDEENNELFDSGTIDFSDATKPEPKKISSYLQNYNKGEYILSEEQIEVLQNAAKEHIFPNEEVRMQLAKQLGMSFGHVSRWFTGRIKRNSSVPMKKRTFKEFCSFDPRKELLEDIYSRSSTKYVDRTALKRLSRDLSLSVDMIRQWFSKKRDEEKLSENRNLLSEHEDTLNSVLKEHKFPDAKVREDLAEKVGMPFKLITKWFVMKITDGQSDGSSVRVKDPRNGMLEEIYKTNKEPNVKQVSMDLALPLSYVTAWFLRRQERENKQMIALIEAAERRKKNKYLQKCRSSVNVNSGVNVNHNVNFFMPEYRDYSPRPQYVAPCTPATNKVNAVAFTNIHVKEDQNIKKEATSEYENAEPNPLFTDTTFGNREYSDFLDDSGVEVEINPLMFCQVVDVASTDDEPPIK